MAELYANNVAGALASAIDATQTTLTLQAGHNFYDPAGDWYRATLYTTSIIDGKLVEDNHEVVKVTAVSGDTVTVERGLEGTAGAFDAGTPIEHRLTAGAVGAVAGGGGVELGQLVQFSQPMGDVYVNPENGQEFLSEGYLVTNDGVDYQPLFDKYPYGLALAGTDTLVEYPDMAVPGITQFGNLEVVESSDGAYTAVVYVEYKNSNYYKTLVLLNTQDGSVIDTVNMGTGSIYDISKVYWDDTSQCFLYGRTYYASNYSKFFIFKVTTNGTISNHEVRNQYVGGTAPTQQITVRYCGDGLYVILCREDSNYYVYAFDSVNNAANYIQRAYASMLSGAFIDNVLYICFRDSSNRYNIYESSDRGVTTSTYNINNYDIYSNLEGDKFDVFGEMYSQDGDNVYRIISLTSNELIGKGTTFKAGNAFFFLKEDKTLKVTFDGITWNDCNVSDVESKVFSYSNRYLVCTSTGVLRSTDGITFDTKVSKKVFGRMVSDYKGALGFSRGQNTVLLVWANTQSFEARDTNGTLNDYAAIWVDEIKLGSFIVETTLDPSTTYARIK